MRAAMANLRVEEVLHNNKFDGGPDFFEAARNNTTSILAKHVMNSLHYLPPGRTSSGTLSNNLSKLKGWQVSTHAYVHLHGQPVGNTTRKSE